MQADGISTAIDDEDYTEQSELITPSRGHVTFNISAGNVSTGLNECDEENGTTLSIKTVK
jgi:hypothetical protein